jgi:hypothetical protein
MSEHNEKHDLTPEGSGINVKPIVWFLIILTLVVAASFGTIRGLIWGMNKLAAASAGPPKSRVAEGERRLPPVPRLQGAPEPDPKDPNKTQTSLLPLEDMKAYREQVERATQQYGWADGKEGGAAHIPIERAKQLILERGLPTKAEAAMTELQTVEAMRKQVLNADASAGRMIGKTAGAK